MSAAKFPPVSREQWQAKAEKDLKGRPLSSLQRATADGVPVEPLYMGDRGDGNSEDSNSYANSLPGQFPGTRGRTAGGAAAGSGWLAVQELRHADVRAANAAARHDAQFGAHGFAIVLDDQLQAGRAPDGESTGLLFDPSQDVPALLDGLDVADTTLLIHAGLLARPVLDGIEDYLADAGLDEDEAPQLSGGVLAPPLRGGVIYDPFTPLLRTGSLERSFEAALGEGVDAVLGSPLGLVGVSTEAYHDAGAGDAEELALALASLAEFLRRGEPLGLEAADLLPTVVLTLPIAGRPFEAIAKLRAARTLWAKLTTACGLSLERAPLWIHATSSRREWTRVGPWVNLLRGTVGSFAAAVGGADSISTASFDGLCGPEGDAVGGLGRGSELGRRLAVNTQAILRDECGLDRVIDPAGGSWAVEALTDAIARAAWTRFQAIEAEGGLVDGLVSGRVQAHIHEQADALGRQIARRRRPITGVSTFPVLDGHPPPEQSADAPPEDFEAPHRSAPVLEPAELPEPLPRLRAAAPFEALRARAATLEPAPRLVAVNWGSLANHQARTDFAANLFAAGGIAVEALPGQTEVAAAGQAFAAAGASLAVVCGRDEDYAEHGAELIDALRSAGAAKIWIAGCPPKDDLGAWGLDGLSGDDLDFIHRGCDALSVLDDALTRLESPITPTAGEAS